MKTFSLIVCSLVLFIVAECNAASIRRHKRQIVPKEFANINIENYLKNDRAVQFQLKCIVYDGPCDRIGKYLKVTIPELLTNQCQNCEPGQRQRAGRLVQHIQQKFPKEWSDAVQKFQGGQVKKEDADRLESLLGVKLDSKLVAEATTTTTTTTAAPVTTTTTTTTTTVAPPPSTEATTTTTTTVSPPSSSSSTSTALPETTSALPVVSSSLAPEEAITTSTSTSTVAPVLVSSVAPTSQSYSSTTVPSTSMTTPEVSPSSTTTTTTTLAPSTVASVESSSSTSTPAVVV